MNGTPTIDRADIARGARIELLIEAVQNGRTARAAGLWAGMSREEREEFGPLIRDAVRPR